MDLTVGAAIAVIAATAIGATIQGAIGFGMNLVTVPVLALVLPASLPITAIVLGIPISITMTRYERHALDWQGLRWIVAGRVPGTILGAWVVAAASTSALQGIAGGIVLVLVTASLLAPPVTVAGPSQLAAGIVSGVTGTAAGIGGPPLALLYQRHPGPTMRSTLAASFMVGTALSLGTLAIAQQFGAKPVLLGAALAPVVIAGTVGGRRLHRILDRGWLRPAVLLFAAAAALAALVRALT